MRILLLLTALCFLTNCTVAEEDLAGGGNNNTSGSKDVKFKTITGGYETLSTDSITQLKVSVSDSSGATTVTRIYSLPESSNRAKDLGLNEPGQKNLGTLKQTGSVEIQFIATGTTQIVTRTFAVYNYQYVQDSMFPDVIYNAKNKITFDWFEQQ